MTKKELAALTIAELKALAKKKKIALASGAKKADIIAALAESKTGSAKTVGGKKQAPAKAKGKTSAGKQTPQTSRIAKATGKGAKAAGSSPAGKASVRVAASASPVKKTVEREWKIQTGREEPSAAQERVSDAKFYTGPAEARLEAPSGSLPVEYGQDRIVLLARDPHTVFAFWELAQGRLDEERSRMGGDPRLCIRVYDVTGVLFDGRNEVASFDQEVYERVGSWYLDLGRPNRNFCAELGIRSTDGRFRPLLRSNAILMPREGFSDALDEEWMIPEEEFLRLYGVPALGGMSSAHIRELIRKRRRLEISSPGLSGKFRT